MTNVDGADEATRRKIAHKESDGPDDLTRVERAELNHADVSALDRTLKDGDESDGLFAAREVFLAWARGHFATVEYVHTDKRAPWCPEWWKHPEVVERLWNVWQARLQAEEDAAARLDAISDWWLTHWDRHAAILFDSRTGPFRNCDRTLGHLHDTAEEVTAAVKFERPPNDWRPNL